MLLPFVQINGHWHVIVNWKPDMEPGQNLYLRPLMEAESTWLETQFEDAFFEIWARLFPDDESIINGSIPPEDD